MADIKKIKVLGETYTIVDSNAVTLNTDQTIAGTKTFDAPENVAGKEQATTTFKTANGGQIIFGKEASNSGTLIGFDQVDGTRRLNFRASNTSGAMVWEQPEANSCIYFDVANANFRDTTSLSINYLKNALLLGTDSSGKLLSSTASNVVSLLGTTPVNRATADKNGNDITTTYALKSAIPTKVSQLTNDSAYITKSVSELTYFYTKTSIDNLFSTLKKNSYQVVATKPTTGEEGYVYLVGTSAPYEMWIYEASSSAADKWIDLGSTSVDLTGYVKGSSLTDNKVILGNAGSNIKASSVGISATLGSDDTTIPTSKAVQTALASKQDKISLASGEEALSFSNNTLNSIFSIEDMIIG